MSNIKLFQSKQIRSVWNEEEHQQQYFSVVDVVGALTDSIDPSAYWIKLKQCLILEENEPGDKLSQVELKPENPTYKSLRFNKTEIEQFRIIGKAIAFQRDII